MSIVDIAAGGVPAQRSIEAITGEILEAKRVGGEAVLTIGRGLIEAKGMLPHGEWLPWLTEKVEFSERSAQNFMRIAKEWSNPQLVADLGARKALALLALPEPEREEFVSQSHVVDGTEKSVSDMSARELEQAIRERDAARRAADEALVEKSLAEQARDKLADEVKIAAAAKEQAEQALERAREETDRAADAVLAMEKELKELKGRPVEVAVEVDQAAVDKARAEGEAQAEKEFKKARKEAQRQVSEANAAAAQTKTELDQARREIENLKLELRRTEKPSPLAADTELAQFKLLFDQVQGLLNQMHGLLIKLRAREDGAAAGKLAQALAALSERVRGWAQ